MEFLPNVVNDGLIHFHAAHLNGLGDHQTAQRNYRHIGSAAADVHHHGADGLIDRQTGTDRRRVGLFNQIHGFSTSQRRRLLHRLPGDHGQCTGHADKHLGLDNVAHADGLADKVPQKDFRHIKVHNAARLQRTNGYQLIARAAQQYFRLVAYCADVALIIAVDHNDRRFADHNAPAANINHGIGCTQIDPNFRCYQRHATIPSCSFPASTGTPAA